MGLGWRFRRVSTLQVWWESGLGAMERKAVILLHTVQAVFFSPLEFGVQWYKGQNVLGKLG